jgi:hypothetical protein
MNPLSSHPPRTPRASLVVAHSHVYGTNVYENGEEKQEQSVVVDEGEEEEDKIPHFQPKVRKEDVWREIIITSVGRDKAFVSLFFLIHGFGIFAHACVDVQKKLIQYSIRVYLFFHFSLSTSPLLRKTPRPLWEKEFTKRLTSTASGLSFTRFTSRCAKLYNFEIDMFTPQEMSPSIQLVDTTHDNNGPTNRPLFF